VQLVADTKKVVEPLLKNGADTKAGDFYETALHAAAENGHAEVVRLLLQERADINAEDEERETALGRAVSRRGSGKAGAGKPSHQRT
jgi:ankyrin repeat protein